MSSPILITGAAGDIGYAVAEALKENALLLTDRTENGRRWTDRAQFIPADLPGDATRLIECLPARLSGIVHSLGIIKTHDALDLNSEDFDAVFRTNVYAPLALTAALAERVEPGGAIVFVGSVAGTRPTPNNLLYGASKAALHHAARTLSIVLAPKRIRVNVVVPGLIETDLTRVTDQEIARLDHSDAETVHGRRVAGIPIGHIGTPADVAAAVRFLMSPQAAFVVGTEFAVTGGGHNV